MQHPLKDEKAKYPIKTKIAKEAIWKPEINSAKNEHRCFFQFNGKMYGQEKYYRSEKEAKEETSRLVLIDLGIVPSSKRSSQLMFGQKDEDGLLDMEDMDDINELGYFTNDDDKQ